jgi:hypothetical protein
MADIVLDANVLVGWLDSRDTLAERSDEGFNTVPSFRRID